MFLRFLRHSQKSGGDLGDWEVVHSAQLVAFLSGVYALTAFFVLAADALEGSLEPMGHRAFRLFLACNLIAVLVVAFTFDAIATLAPKTFSSLCKRFARRRLILFCIGAAVLAIGAAGTLGVGWIVWPLIIKSMPLPVAARVFVAALSLLVVFYSAVTFGLHFVSFVARERDTPS